MSRRLWTWLLCIAALMISIPVVGAQASNWSTWLYNRDNGRMLRIDANGTILEDITLPLLQNHPVYSYNVAVSHDGNLISYTVYSPDMFTTQFLTYDIRVDDIIQTYSPGRITGDSIDFLGIANAYNDFDTAFAYGYAVEGAGWQIVVLDYPGRREAFRLRSTDSIVTAAGVPADLLWTPVVRRYTGTEITFSMIASGTEGQPEYDAYVWNTVLGNIQKSIAYPTLMSDSFNPSGEIISPALDERLGNQINTLPIPYQLNSIQVYDPTTGGSFPFFSDAKLTINNVEFIENGRRILINAFDVNDTTSADPRFWAVLERSGQLISYMPIPKDSRSVAGLADGFIYTIDPTQAADNATSLIQMVTEGNANSGHYVWTSEPGATYRIVWAQDSRTPNAIAQAALPSWTQLAPPIFNAGTSTISPQAVPSPTSISGPILAIGNGAIVNTTEGDTLRVRSGPGLSFSVTANLDPGVRVILLEGPRNAEGFVWWRVRTPSNQEGWVVESADGIRTLLPN